MKRLLLTLILCGAIVPVWADTDLAETNPAPEQGRDLLQDGMRLLMEGLRQEMAPALEDLKDLTDDLEPTVRDFVLRMAPAWQELMEQIGDLSLYHAPEVLPNGDVILRRKPDKGPSEALEKGQIDI